MRNIAAKLLASVLLVGLFSSVLFAADVAVVTDRNGNLHGFQATPKK
jgi:hypothetical protein